jgi:hypothetical protein
VTWMGDMRRRGFGPQARIDPDEEQLEARADQVGNRRITNRLQLCLGKAHTCHRSGHRSATKVPQPEAGDRRCGC